MTAIKHEEKITVDRDWMKSLLHKTKCPLNIVDGDAVMMTIDTVYGSGRLPQIENGTHDLANTFKGIPGFSTSLPPGSESFLPRKGACLSYSSLFLLVFTLLNGDLLTEKIYRN